MYEKDTMYTVKVSNIYKKDDKIWFEEKENLIKNGPRAGASFKSYKVRVQFDKFGDTWFKGFVSESKRTPGEPLIWEGMEMFVTISDYDWTYEGKTGTTPYFSTYSASKKEAYEKDQKIAKMEAQLQQMNATNNSTTENVVQENSTQEVYDEFADLQKESVNEEDIPF